MKTFIYTLVLGLTLSACTTDKKQTVISVLEDVTEADFLVTPESNTILSQFKLDRDLWQGVQFRYGSISSLVHNERIAYQLPSKTALLSNEIQRKTAVKQFKADVSKALKKDSYIAEHRYSAIWTPLVAEIKSLQAIPNSDNTLYLFSDLQENNPDWFSLLKYEDAIESYSLTLKLDDPTSFALLRIGQCHEKLGNKDLAVQYYYKTVKEDPLLDKGWIAITKFYNKKKNYQKSLYYINKAINIDSDNVIYWKLYAQINQRLGYLEEAERGYKRALELGNYELSTWLTRGDILWQLGEPEAAIYNLLQASEFYPENAEIEFRLAGLYYSQNDTETGSYHLKNGIRFNSEYAIIIEELFPKVYNKSQVQTLLKA